MRAFKLNSDEEYEKAEVRKGALLYEFENDPEHYNVEIKDYGDGRFYRYDDPDTCYRERFEWTKYDEDGNLDEVGHFIGYCQEEDCTWNCTEEQLFEAFKKNIKNECQKSKKVIDRLLTDQEYIKHSISRLAPNSQKIEESVIKKIDSKKNEISKSICEELGIKEKNHHR